jgi:mannosyltransferase OCH1-like enzyme
MNNYILILIIFILIRFGENWKRRRIQRKRSDYIPLNIWQTYKTDKLPKRARDCQRTWANQKKYHYHFMDDTQIHRFMIEYFSPRVVDTFERMPIGVMKADMWRYCVLYIHGGIYSDIDSVSLKPIKDWNIQPEDEIIIALENDLHFCQWTILAAPRHPILATVIQMIVDDAMKGFQLDNEHFVHQHTGPGIWTRAIHQTLGLPQDQKAQQTYDMYTSGKHVQVFKKYGVRLENDTFFAGDNVRNLYGSTQFGNDYASWMNERDQLLKKSKKKSKDK